MGLNVSDHLPIYFIRKKLKVHREQTNFGGRSHRNLVDEELREQLLEFDWINFGENDINTCWIILYTRIDVVVNKLCPMKDFKFAKSKPKWMLDDLIELMKNRYAS